MACEGKIYFPGHFYVTALGIFKGVRSLGLYYVFWWMVLHSRQVKPDAFTQLKQKEWTVLHNYKQQTGHFYTTNSVKAVKRGRFYTAGSSMFTAPSVSGDMNSSGAGATSVPLALSNSSCAHPSGNLPNTATKSLIYICFFFSTLSGECRY